MNRKAVTVVFVAFLAVAPGRAGEFPGDTAFTYQGHLKDAGAPFNGLADLRFALFDAEGAGNQIGSTVDRDEVSVVNGLFQVPLDFGAGAFIASPLWLEVAVRRLPDPTETAPFTVLNPRQALTATPFSLRTRGVAVDLAENVGIGTLFTTHRLTVGAPDQETVRLFRSGTTYGEGARLNFGDEDYVFIEEDLDDRLQIQASRTALMGGNIGIGTLAPAAKLEIQGTTAGAIRFDPDGIMIGSNADGYELNLVGGEPDGSTMGGQIRLGGSGRGDADVNVIQFKQNDSEVMRIHNGGNVGIGTPSPAAKLEVVGGEVRLPGGANPANYGTHFNWAGDGRNYIRGATIIADTGNNVGIGTSHTHLAKLHLYDPGSVNLRIESGGGTNAWSRAEFANGDGQWNVGTSRNFNGNQLYFHREGSPNIALGLQPNGDAYLQGNANQARDKGGWVKAMARVPAFPASGAPLPQSYSAFGGSITAEWNGFSYRITFPFQVNDRFIQVTPFLNGSVGAVTANVTSFPSANIVLIHIKGLNTEDFIANEFFIFVY